MNGRKVVDETENDVPFIVDKRLHLCVVLLKFTERYKRFQVPEVYWVTEARRTKG